MSSSYLACNNFYSKVKTDTKIYDEFRSQVINTKAVISNSIKFGNGSFLISPAGEKNFVAKFVVDNSLSVVYINVDINTDDSIAGDSCVIMVKKLYNNNNPVYISFTEKFYYTACGDNETTSQTNNADKGRYVRSNNLPRNRSSVWKYRH
jgi:hypothetical protein